MTPSLWRMFENQVVEGKYHLNTFIGAGGFGAVYLAQHVVRCRDS